MKATAPNAASLIVCPIAITVFSTTLVSGQRIAPMACCQSFVMDKYLTSRRTVLLLLRAHEEHRGHRRGHLRPGRRLSPEPATPGAALRKGGASRRPHQYGPDSPPRTAASRSIPASWCTTTAPIRTWCGCSGSSAWPPATRTCRSRCRAGGPASSTAAAAPTGSSRSGGTWSSRRTSPCSGRSCASIGKRRRCSMRRTRSARRWETFSSRAVSASRSRTAICCPWRRPSGRPRSTRSDRFRRSR